MLLDGNGFPFRPALEVAVTELVLNVLELSGGIENGGNGMYELVLTTEEKIPDGECVLELSDEDVLDGSLVSVD